jgi:hypothetical protein
MQRPHRDIARRVIFTTLLTLPVLVIAAAGYLAGVAGLASVFIMIPCTLMFAFTYASYLENITKTLEGTFKNYRCLSWLLNRCARQHERLLDFVLNGCNLTVAQISFEKTPNTLQMAALAAVPALDDNQDALEALGNAEFSGKPQLAFTEQYVIKRGVVVQGTP